MAQRRQPNDEVFGRVVPTDSTLDFIETLEGQGWYLITTRSEQDRSVPKLHKVLERDHKENMFQYQMVGTLEGATVSLNLYFLRDEPA